ncbi:DUF2787 family protein [Vibrio crassostreae]|uniref:DUF2787 family protein n=1 Tax=Vibrio crassostreae TaxID=246167 RepID=UPI0010533BA0|nr:DUF2787 family protein [Vibrio crassostreae]TCT61081.1 uncharacterized protein DUF2787 [Vibrio crassostreae]
MNTVASCYDNEVTLLPSLVECLSAALDSAPIPINVDKLSMNFRHTPYYQTRRGTHPVEVRLERHDQQWRVVFIASFAYPDETHRSVIPELYFNFKRGWFYQPDIKGCELARPEVMDVLLSWSRMFCRQLMDEHFDDVRFTEVKT